MTNEIFLLAFHEIPIMWPIACILEYFAVEKLSRKLAFRMVVRRRQDDGTEPADAHPRAAAGDLPQ